MVTTLNTSRLKLDFLTEKDLPFIHQIRTNKEVNTYLERNGEANIEESRQWLLDRIEDTKAERSYTWSMRLTHTELVIGTICFWNIAEDKRTADLGYELLPAHQGKGLMKEALEEILPYGFENLRFETIEAWSHIENEASWRLLEKLGFKPSITKEIEHDHRCFILSRP